jgi:hypothetical protein
MRITEIIKRDKGTSNVAIEHTYKSGRTVRYLIEVAQGQEEAALAEFQADKAAAIEKYDAYVERV